MRPVLGLEDLVEPLTGPAVVGVYLDGRLEALDGRVEVALVVKGVAQVAVVRGDFRGAGDGFLVERNGTVEFLAGVQDTSQAVEGQGVVGVDSQRRPVMLAGRLWVLLVVKGQAEIVMVGRRSRA